MSFFLAGGGWRRGYGAIAALQFALVAVLWLSRRLWQGRDVTSQGGDGGQNTLSNRDALRLPHAKLALVAFVGFSVTEITAGLWSSSYLVGVEGMAPAVAARWSAAFYGGITVGRLLSGFLFIKLKNESLIRGGQVICALGALLLMLPLPASLSALGFVLLGLGTAPIFPAMLHETPRRFGEAASGAVMGLQMAVAYTGGTLGPPLFGALASLTSLKLLPYYLLAAICTMLVASELLARRLARGEGAAN
ncbi:MFS transporter [Candidatus Darwinibacter acetoxidans]